MKGSVRLRRPHGGCSFSRVRPWHSPALPNRHPRLRECPHSLLRPQEAHPPAFSPSSMKLSCTLHAGGLPTCSGSLPAGSHSQLGHESTCQRCRWPQTFPSSRNLRRVESLGPHLPHPPSVFSSWGPLTPGSSAEPGGLHKGPTVFPEPKGSGLNPGSKI